MEYRPQPERSCSCTASGGAATATVYFSALSNDSLRAQLAGSRRFNPLAPRPIACAWVWLPFVLQECFMELVEPICGTSEPTDPVTYSIA